MGTPRPRTQNVQASSRPHDGYVRGSPPRPPPSPATCTAWWGRCACGTPGTQRAASQTRTARRPRGHIPRTPRWCRCWSRSCTAQCAHGRRGGAGVKLNRNWRIGALTRRSSSSTTTSSTSSIEWPEQRTADGGRMRAAALGPTHLPGCPNRVKLRCLGGLCGLGLRARMQGGGCGGGGRGRSHTLNPSHARGDSSTQSRLVVSCGRAFVHALRRLSLYSFQCRAPLLPSCCASFGCATPPPPAPAWKGILHAQLTSPHRPPPPRPAAPRAAPPSAAPPCAAAPPAAHSVAARPPPWARAQRPWAQPRPPRRPRPGRRRLLRGRARARSRARVGMEIGATTGVGHGRVQDGGACRLRARNHTPLSSVGR